MLKKRLSTLEGRTSYDNPFTNGQYQQVIVIADGGCAGGAGVFVEDTRTGERIERTAEIELLFKQHETAMRKSGKVEHSEITIVDVSESSK